MFWGCPYQKLDPHVLMMQPVEEGQGYDMANTLNGSSVRRVLVQGKMRSSGVVIACVGLKNSAHMAFTEDHDMV